MYAENPSANSSEFKLSPEQQKILDSLKDPNSDQDTDFKFDGNLALPVLTALIQLPDFYHKTSSFVRPEMFIEKAESLICKINYRLYKEFGESTPEMLRIELSKSIDNVEHRSYYLAKLQEILDTPTFPQAWLLKQVEQLAKKHQWKTACYETSKVLRDEKTPYEIRWEKTVKIFNDLISFSPVTTDTTSLENYDQFMNSVDEQPEFVIEGFLERGMCMLLGADAKAGKTTLMTNTLTDLTLDGEALGGEAKKCPIIYLDYENPRHCLKRTLQMALEGRDARAVAETWQIASRHVPKGSNSKPLPPYLTVEYLAEITKGKEPGIIVVDTFVAANRNRPKLPERWENEQAVIGDIIRPIAEWCHNTDWCVIFLHHTNANGGLRGSTEFRGAVDAIVMMTREGDCGATLKIAGRYGDAIPDKMLRFENGRYHYLGTRKEAAAMEKVNVRDEIVQFLASSPEGSTGGKIKEYLDAKIGKVGKNAVYSHLSWLKDNGIVTEDSKTKQTKLTDDWEMTYNVAATQAV